MEKFKIIMGVLGRIYRVEMDAELMRIYWKLLKIYDIEVIEWAVEEYIRHDENGQFMPKPAQIIRLIDSVQEKRAIDEAYAEWAEILHNNQRGIRLSKNETANEAIRQTGGWEAIRMLTYEGEPWARKAFIERFVAISERKTLINRAEGYAKIEQNMELKNDKEMRVLQ